MSETLSLCRQGGIVARKSRTEIIKDISARIEKMGGYPAWCVGVTESPRQALFKRHGVREGNDAYISRQALDDLQANEIADYFIDSCRTTPGARDNSEDALHVYAYRRGSHTRP